MDILLELVLVGLLGITLLHAIRLQRSLGALRQDRVTFDAAITGFDGGARAAESALARLRTTSDQVEAQIRVAAGLKDDLAFLSDSGERLADQLETLVRSGRNLNAPQHAEPAPTPTPAPGVRSQAERSLLLALQARR